MGLIRGTAKINTVTHNFRNFIVSIESPTLIITIVWKLLHLNKDQLRSYPQEHLHAVEDNNNYGSCVPEASVLLQCALDRTPSLPWIRRLCLITVGRNVIRWRARTWQRQHWRSSLCVWAGMGLREDSLALNWSRVRQVLLTGISLWIMLLQFTMVFAWNNYGQ